MAQWFENLISHFLNLTNWHAALFTIDGWVIIISIVVLEALLSVDNAVVLAAKVHILPTEKEQREALFAGIWTAFLFRLIVIIFAAYFINTWQIKVLGAAYLMCLSVNYFWQKQHPAHKQQRAQKKLHTLLYYP